MTNILWPAQEYMQYNENTNNKKGKRDDDGGGGGGGEEESVSECLHGLIVDADQNIETYHIHFIHPLYNHLSNQRKFRHLTHVPRHKIRRS